MCETDNETRGRNCVYETVKRKEMSPVYSSVYPRLNRNTIYAAMLLLKSVIKCWRFLTSKYIFP
jgi:hypothetical protein